jgi:hypothetical protein
MGSMVKLPFLEFGDGGTTGLSAASELNRNFKNSLWDKFSEQTYGAENAQKKLAAAGALNSASSGNISRGGGKAKEWNEKDWLASLGDFDVKKNADAYNTDAVYARRNAVMIETQERIDSDNAKYAEKRSEELAKQYKKEEEEAAKNTERMLRASLDAAKKQEAEFQRVGDTLGAALVNAIGENIKRLGEGGEVDVGETVMTIVAASLETAGAVIGGIYGMPQLGAAIGSVAGMGAKAIYSASKPKKAKVYHEGGWVDDDIPRYHTGAWIGKDEQMAILQHGERVLSKREVSAAGGPASVDSMANGRGGSSLQVHITAMDTKSMHDSFTSTGGRAFFTAIKSGRGDVARILARAV